MGEMQPDKDFDRFLFGHLLPEIANDPETTVTRKMWAVGLLSFIANELAHGRPVRKVYLSQQLDCAHTTLITHLDYLERKGFITQTRVPAQPPISTQVAIEFKDPSIVERLRERLAL